METNKQILNEMMSNIPTSNDGKNIDKQIVRIGILSEVDAINLYEQLAELATDDDLKNTLLDIANEEKVHVGEFTKLLNSYDNENESETSKGEDEVEEADADKDLKEIRGKMYGIPITEQLNKMKTMFNKINN